MSEPENNAKPFKFSINYNFFFSKSCNFLLIFIFELRHEVKISLLALSEIVLPNRSINAIDFVRLILSLSSKVSALRIASVDSDHCDLNLMLGYSVLNY